MTTPKAIGVISTVYQPPDYAGYTETFWHDGCGAEMKATGDKEPAEGRLTKYLHKCTGCGFIGWRDEAYPRTGVKTL